MTEQQGQPSQGQASQQSQANQQPPQQAPASVATVSQPQVTNPPVQTQPQTTQQQPTVVTVQQPTQQIQQQPAVQQQVQQVQQVQQQANQQQQTIQQAQPSIQQQQAIQQQQLQSQQQAQQQQIQNVQQVQQTGQIQPTSATPNIIQTGNQLAQAGNQLAQSGIRTPGIPQVQVIPQLHSPPYQLSQFPYNQQQIMLQNAMQAAMQASAMNMNMTQQQQLNMAMAMQGRPPSVGGINSPGLLSPSPTTPTQQVSMSFAASATQPVVSSSPSQVVKGMNNKGQTTTTQQAQATALVAGKPIMPTQAMPGTPIVLGQLSVLPNQVANSQAFVTSKGQTFSVAVASNGQQMLTSQAAAIRLSQPQVVSSNNQIINSQPLYTNQAMLQAMANLQQQAAIPLATHQPLLSGTGQSQGILAGQQLFIRAANPLQPQQGIITGIQNLGAQKADAVQGVPGKAAVAGIQVVGTQAGKTMITPLNKTATARINPTVTQRPRVTAPTPAKHPNRGRPRSQSKGAPVAMATASTNTVASALSQARASGSLGQSKPVTPVNQMNQSIVLKSQSDSEVETSKKNTIAELNKKLQDEKDKLPSAIDKPGDVVIEKQRAIVKPHILTHVIEGFVIQEGPEPFPVQRSSLLTEFIPPKPGQVPMDTDSNSPGMSNSPVQSPPEVKKKVEQPAVFEKCEFCGTEEQMAKFSKRSKRFCSMICAKRYNVAHRISQMKPRGRGCGRPPLAGRFMRKRGKPLNIRKGWRPGRGGSRPAYSPKSPLDSDMKDNQYDLDDMSNSSLSDSSATPESPPPPPHLHSHSETDMEIDAPKSHPSKWNVIEVYEFIKSLPGCAPYAEEFRSQEIDGQALMLLKEDHLMTTMSMKLGPALKICAKINSLKDGHD